MDYENVVWHEIKRIVLASGYGRFKVAICITLYDVLFVMWDVPTYLVSCSTHEILVIFLRHLTILYK